MKSRSEIEEEAKKDLAKSLEQLLADIQQESLNDERPLAENLLHAQKRLASLFALSANESRKSMEETNKLQNKIGTMTLWLIVFTILLFCTALSQLYVAIKPCLK